nr:MAG TPA: hypothetical protein [Caudoviricetes sp.]
MQYSRGYYLIAGRKRKKRKFPQELQRRNVIWA